MLAWGCFLRFYIGMMDKEPQPLPESEVIFQDTSKDGSVAITIWRDHVLLTDLMIEAGAAAMGILRIYDLSSLELLHEERIFLSQASILGSGPTEEEVEYWSNLVASYITGE